jgi:hypothetical protein
METQITNYRATVNKGTWSDTERFIVVRLKFKYFCFKLFLIKPYQCFYPHIFFYINYNIDHTALHV